MLKEAAAAIATAKTPSMAMSVHMTITIIIAIAIAGIIITLRMWKTAPQTFIQIQHFHGIGVKSFYCFLTEWLLQPRLGFRLTQMRCCGGCCCYCCCCSCYFGVQPFRFPASPPHTHIHTHSCTNIQRRPLRSLFNSNKISLTAPFAQGTMRVLHILIPSRIRQVPQRLMSFSWTIPIVPRPDQSSS